MCTTLNFKENDTKFNPEVTKFSNWSNCDVKVIPIWRKSNKI